MKTIASVQVRMGSSRLPGKVMRLVRSRPLLAYLLDRLRLSKTLDGIIIATSTAVENDVIEEFCRKEGVACFRGSETDVLDRTLQSLNSMGATVGVEVFGDGPLIDPEVIDQVVDYYVKNPGYDYVGNDLKTTYPPGMEVEVFSKKALSDSSDRLPPSDPKREHGTLFIRQNPDIYKITNIEAPARHHRPDLELEVDTSEDFQVISRVIEHFSGRTDFTLEEIIEFMDGNPEISNINRQVPRRWKKYRE